MVRDVVRGCQLHVYRGTVNWLVGRGRGRRRSRGRWMRFVQAAALSRRQIGRTCPPLLHTGTVPTLPVAITPATDNHLANDRACSTCA